MNWKSFCPSLESNFNLIKGTFFCEDGQKPVVLGAEQGIKKEEVSSLCLPSGDEQLFCNATSEAIPAVSCLNSACQFEMKNPFDATYSPPLGSLVFPGDDACLLPPDKRDVLIRIKFRCVDEAASSDWVWVAIGIAVFFSTLIFLFVIFAIIRRKRNGTEEGGETKDKQIPVDPDYGYEVVDDGKNDDPTPAPRVSKNNITNENNSKNNLYIDLSSSDNDEYVKLDFDKEFDDNDDERRNHQISRHGNGTLAPTDDHEYLKALSIRLPVQKED